MAKIPFTNWEINSIKEAKAPIAFFSNKGSISIEEAGKAFMPSMIKMPTDVGLPHPFDFQVYENAYKTVPIINAATDKQTNYAVGPDYYVESEDEEVREVCNHFFEKSHFNIWLSLYTRNMLVYGSSFSEKIWVFDEELNWLTPQMNNLDPKFMYIRMDNKFQLLGYTQYDGQKKAFFDPDEIVHAPFNQIGDSPYGNSMFSSLVMGGKVQPLLNKLVVEDIMIKILKRKANSPLHFRIGNDQYQPSQAVVDDFGAHLQNLKEDTEFVTSYLVDGKVYDFNLAKFDYPLQHYENQVIYALQTPHVLLGLGSVPEGLAKVQWESFLRRIQSIQQTLEKVIENDILKPMLLKNNIKAEVKFKWGIPTEEDKTLEIQKYLSLVNSFSITPLTKFDIENKIRAILELDPLTEMPQPQAQPQNPFQPNNPNNPNQNNPQNQNNQQNQNQSFASFLTTEGKRPKWYSIKEDIASDFAVNSYVMDFIKSYLFPDITDFSKRKKNVLRDVLQNGIENQDPIPTMVKDLMNRTGIDSVKAEAIVRTELARAENQGTLDAYADSGEVEKVKWLTADDERVCEICGPLDGTVLTIEEARLQLPKHVNCRCTSVGILKPF